MSVFADTEARLQALQKQKDGVVDRVEGRRQVQKDQGGRVTMHGRQLGGCPTAPAVSVEWPGRNPDCNSGRRSADVRRSRSYDSTDRFEIGRYELVSVASSPGFFTAGVTNAYEY